MRILLETFISLRQVSKTRIVFRNDGLPGSASLRCLRRNKFRAAPFDFFVNLLPGRPELQALCATGLNLFWCCGHIGRQDPKQSRRLAADLNDGSSSREIGKHRGGEIAVGRTKLTA